MNGSAPGPRLLDSRSACQAALREGLAEAAQAGSAELLLCDADFVDWPLGEAAVVEQLTAWAGARRRLTVLAHRYDGIVQHHARWVAWRRQWAHLVECRELLEAEAGDLPCLLLAPRLAAVRVHDRRHWRGTVTRDPSSLLQCREELDALLQRSTPAFPAHTLGL